MHGIRVKKNERVVQNFPRFCVLFVYVALLLRDFVTKLLAAFSMMLNLQNCYK
jgi:hypothetical protein